MLAPAAWMFKPLRMPAVAAGEGRAADAAESRKHAARCRVEAGARGVARESQQLAGAGSQLVGLGLLAVVAVIFDVEVILQGERNGVL